MTPSVVIQTHDLTKKYGRHKALDGLDLAVNQGDFYGFIGPNGAGKSTTIRILLGLIHKTKGSSNVFGYECGPNQIDILERVGYLPSETAFYPNMKVKQILQLSAKLHQDDNKVERERLCDLFELDPSLKVNELSLGNRKKVAIICALQHHPLLYILDEPTSGLDPLMQERFWQELKARHEEGATIFVSSHVLSEVQRYCNKAAFIRQGRIILEDYVENLLKNAAKRVTLHGITEIGSIEGMSQISHDDHSVSFLYQGQPKALLELMSPYQEQLLDLQIQELSMEELFRHFYDRQSDKELN